MEDRVRNAVAKAGQSKSQKGSDIFGGQQQERVSAGSDALLSRIGIRSDRKPGSWSDSFSPLIRDYAELSHGTGQAERHSDCWHEPHLQFLIHGFVEDRSLDGQIVLDAEEAAFVEAVSRGGGYPTRLGRYAVVIFTIALWPPYNWHNKEGDPSCLNQSP